MRAPVIVLVGGLAKLPHAGLSLYYLHHVAGLQELGYRVHYVERQNRPLETYDPVADAMTDDPDQALRHLDAVAARWGLRGAWSFIDLAGNCHGAGWGPLRADLDVADAVVTVADPTWFDDLARCPRRAFIDGDPMFTQTAVAAGEGTRADAPLHYTALFTYAARIGRPGCLVPDAGLRWLPARPVVATRRWTPAPPAPAAPLAALMHWAAGSPAVHEGQEYGHKDREFMGIVELPRRRPGRYLLAAGGGGVPAHALGAAGWTLVSAAAVSASVENFTQFVTSARADLGVAKHAYVASRSGWFSDRSTCFLAAGRPVLHQDTGFGDWLPAGDGVLAFSDLESLLEATERLDRDYARHAAAARGVAEEHFEARDVMSSLLEAAGAR